MSPVLPIEPRNTQAASRQSRTIPAVDSARVQYNDIRSHWTASFAVMLVLAVVSAAAVIMSMRKVRQRKK